MIMVLTIFVSEESPTVFERVLSETMLQTDRGAGYPERGFLNA